MSAGTCIQTYVPASSEVQPPNGPRSLESILGDITLSSDPMIQLSVGPVETTSESASSVRTATSIGADHAMSGTSNR